MFYRDAILNATVSWEQLIVDLNQTSSYNPYCRSADFYTVFKHIVVSLWLKQEIVLLDADFTEEELLKLTGYSSFESFTKPIHNTQFKKIESKAHLLKILSTSNTDWKITLFTSGTTGMPKKVSHSFASLARFVKKTTTLNVWGFAYHPTHMAGLQVFFQAFLNGNTMVRMFGLSREEIFKVIKEFGITHISATPSFFRLLLPIVASFPTVIRLTSGGEKFDAKTMQALKLAFPQAKINNVYASTEAGCLFAAEGDVFTIKPELQHSVRIENNELFIHHSLMGEAVFTTAEWYASGDIVDVLDSNPTRFRFISRKNEMINVGGNKVNPQEVEEVLRSISGITEVRVYAKPNSVMGNIICCEVVTNDPQLEEAGIRLLLHNKLQEFKIPRMIQFVDRITTTRSGKLKR